MPCAGTPSQGHGLAGSVVQAWQNLKNLLGGGRGRPGRGRGHHRHAARPAQRRARLVAEARPGRPAGHHQLESAGTLSYHLPPSGGGSCKRRCQTHAAIQFLDSIQLARARAGDRPHPSITRAFSRHGLAYCRRQYLRQRAPFRRTTAAFAFPRDRNPDFKDKEPVRAVAPAPKHMHERLRACGWNGE